MAPEAKTRKFRTNPTATMARILGETRARRWLLSHMAGESNPSLFNLGLSILSDLSCDRSIETRPYCPTAPSGRSECERDEGPRDGDALDPSSRWQHVDRPRSRDDRPGACRVGRPGGDPGLPRDRTEPRNRSGRRAGPPRLRGLVGWNVCAVTTARPFRNDGRSRPGGSLLAGRCARRPRRREPDRDGEGRRVSLATAWWP